VSDRPLAVAAADAVAALHASLDDLDPRSALAAVFALVERANRFVEETAPWALHKAGRDDELDAVLARHAGVDPALDAARGKPPARIREVVRARLHDEKVITADYKHVDGTSFAAPIVSSVAAQMLEANPALAPHEIKRLLIDSARRLGGVDVDRQGWGAIDPEKAVLAALGARRRRAARRRD
jgi:subtilisin family serine protease